MISRGPARSTPDSSVAVHGRERRSHANEHAPALRLVRQSEVITPYGTRRDLARALDSIPPKQRDALVLFHVVGMTLNEVAAEIGVSPDTIKSRLRLGRDKLRAALGHDEEAS